MKTITKLCLQLLIYFLSLIGSAPTQELRSVNWTYSQESGLAVQSVTLKSSEQILLNKATPLFSFLVNDKFYDSFSAENYQEGEVTQFEFPFGVSSKIQTEKGFKKWLESRTNFPQ